MRIITKYLTTINHEKDIADINVKEIDRRYIYEITITFNRQYFCTQQDAFDHINYIIEKLIFKIADNRYDYNGTMMDYNIEYHQDGWPHVHGTIFSTFRWPNSKIHNVQHFFNREVGRTMIYYTGQKIKYHEVPQMYWDDYIKKDGTENYNQIAVYNKHFYSIEEQNLISLQ